MEEVRIGIALWPQATGWPELLAAAQRVETLGYDHLWVTDHLYAPYGDLHQPIVEGYAALAALAQATQRVRLGLLVGANTFRNPGLTVKTVTTIDHISGGRAILGIGGGWHEEEHRAFGLDLGSGHGQRLDWLAEAVSAARTLLDGGTVTSAGGRYTFRDLRIAPLPLQAHLPIMVGGSGERKTLPIVARWADMWNAFESPHELERKDAVLRDLCHAAGRDPTAIERTVGCKITLRRTEAEAHRVFDAFLAHNRTPRDHRLIDDSFWTGTPEQVAEIMIGYRRIGFHTFINELPAPYDEETLETLIGVVRPIVEAADIPA